MGKEAQVWVKRWMKLEEGEIKAVAAGKEAVRLM